MQKVSQKSIKIYKPKHHVNIQQVSALTEYKIRLHLIHQSSM